LLVLFVGLRNGDEPAGCTHRHQHDARNKHSHLHSVSPESSEGASPFTLCQAGDDTKIKP
jgi:hypothetical protein